MVRKKRIKGVPSLSKEERMARALKIYNNAPETVRTPAQQKAYERAKKNELSKSTTKAPKLHIKLLRAHIINGGLPSLGKR